jgi:uncharacterized iron-regulated protein
MNDRCGMEILWSLLRRIRGLRLLRSVRPVRASSLLLLLPILLLLISGCSIRRVMRVENREVIDVKTMIGEINNTPLVFVGERHDAPAHHELQLEILKAKLAQGKQLAIGMEMFDDANQRALDAWVAGKVPEPAFRRLFEMSWRNISWELYCDIFRFARAEKIPIVALNAPRELVQKVAHSGFGSLTVKELDQLPVGIDAEVSDTYLDFIRAAYPVHRGNPDGFRYICEAQMLRNRVMARRISEYFLLHPETSMVVIAGGGHAREKGGVPAELKRIPYKIVLPPIPALTSATVTRSDGDYLLEEPFFWLAEIL